MVFVFIDIVLILRAQNNKKKSIFYFPAIDRNQCVVQGEFLYVDGGRICFADRDRIWFADRGIIWLADRDRIWFAPGQDKLTNWRRIKLAIGHMICLCPG